ncbi:MAG: BglG family transcription antiterminator [Staphylococcus equorum]|uniref:BglG family transcription antiterminator n=1 Tax=Staphylococcus TaxID=1279 RepID=UPI00085308F8|nr:BglG family transcription antiterminator [Staphylococcus equorum]MDG0823410.1 BglG family transcription antiterminator [Staphylococcus equorum]MDG0836767.1 BglG family transcription antiterminator [Staphylococcus equorum]MDK9871359.1 BglG family transcription antiterminator [Staphylococcus equorum]MDK9877596.1 BglG family transcription antiterminator [Staphylococcus equorum]MDN5829095.1 BglG family transcription antiterminator [Staphylococcus equorum]
MQERHAKLIRLILNNNNDYLSANEIANYLNVSNRTVRSDIKYINSELVEELIVSVKGRGYKMNRTLYSVEQLAEIVTAFTNKESEILLKLGYQLLMHQQPMTIDQLENDFDLTKSEVNDYLNRIQSWCTSFDISVNITKKKGITVNGNEMNIRNAILHLNQLSTKDQTVEQFILNEIPEAHIQMIFQIIKSNLSDYQIQTSDIRIRQLLIHLIIIFKRNNDDDASWVIDEESQIIAQHCIDEINKKLAYGLSDETAKLFSFFISYYFNKYDLGLEKVFVKSYIDRMIYQMEKSVGVNFTKDKALRDNVYSHFSRTYLRIAKNVYINNPLTEDIKKHYPFVFNTLYETVNHLSKDAKINLVEDEIAFLALHFQSSIDRNEKNRFNIVITCYYGLGISSLLEAKIANLDDRIYVIDTLKLEDVSQYDFSGVDALITTYFIDKSQVPDTLQVMEVSPLFSNEDANKIQSFIRHKQNPVLNQDELAAIQFDVHSDKQELTEASYVFEQAQIIFRDNHSVTEKYIQSALEREKFSSTFIGKGISIPHGDPEKVLKSHVVIFKNMQGFGWKQNRAKLVFFLAIAEQDIPAMKKIIHTIANLTENDVDQLLVLEDQILKDKVIQLVKE